MKIPLQRPWLAKGMRIGLLGGSFNPAHEGHRDISLTALARLKLDRVWWMVSPQNPLKSTDGMAGLNDRLETARKIANHPRIHVTDIERVLGTQFTRDTLVHLCTVYPHVYFVWLMGADNMIQLPKWYGWQQIMRTVPVAVIDRPGYGLKAQMGKAAQTFDQARINEEEAAMLPTMKPPAWVMLHAKLNPTSATGLRNLIR